MATAFVGKHRLEKETTSGPPETSTRSTSANTSNGRTRYCTLTAHATASNDASMKGGRGKHRQHLFERGVVGAVVVDVLVPDLRARTDDEGRPELRDAPPRLVDPVPGGTRPLGTCPAPPVREQPKEPDAANRGRPGG